MPAPGRIVFVVGPSGAGKDSLLRYAATRLADDPRFVFPRRVITRRPVPEAENHDSMTPEEFLWTVREGGFALFWQAHGLHYGIPIAMDDDLASGRTVAINVSRNVLAVAVERYPHHLIASIEAPAGVLAKRLAQRGREGTSDIGERLARRATALPSGAHVATLVNDATLESAGERFVMLLSATQAEDHRRDGARQEPG